VLSSASVVASIPSPPISSFQARPLTTITSTPCILAGIVVAAFMTNHRLTKRGAESWVVIDICLLAVPWRSSARAPFHVVTHWGFYFEQGREWWNPFVRDAIWNVWDGGIAIFGALIGGAIGAWLGCKWTGIRFWTFADALAPGLLLAQALGRFGNWFNQELYGLPTDLPWGCRSTTPTRPGRSACRRHALSTHLPLTRSSGTRWA
jgi:prolipoprotein diacylglyceryltransferase